MVQSSMEAQQQARAEVLEYSPSVTQVQILSVPRGCFLSAEQTANPESLLEHVTPDFVPFAPTPPLPALMDQSVGPATLEPIAEQPVVEVEVEPPSVTRLDSWRERRRSDDETPVA